MVSPKLLQGPRAMEGPMTLVEYKCTYSISLIFDNFKIILQVLEALTRVLHRLERFL